MSDTQILELFRQGHRQKAFTELYKLYPRIQKLILSKGGSKTDAQDVFQESLIILYRKLVETDFKLSSSFYTYLYSVARFYWSDLQQKEKKEQQLKSETSGEDLQQIIYKERLYTHAENAFLELGSKCQKLLKSFYHQRLSFKEIAEAMGFSSEKIAKNQKYKCLKKAKDIFNRNHHQS